ncbi:MAG: hypothetical protein ACRCX5_14520 [Bacteroidales bacterium]
MKEKCDNICNTCPVNSQIYCALFLAKANNQNSDVMSKRLEVIESVLLNMATKIEGSTENITYLTPDTKGDADE